MPDQPERVTRYILTESAGYENTFHDPGLRLDRGRILVDASAYDALLTVYRQACEERDHAQKEYEDIIEYQLKIEQERDKWRQLAEDREDERDRKVVEQRDTLRARLAQVEGALRACMADLQWCSGSPDFGPGGQARQGWLKGPALTLQQANKALDPTPEEEE